MMLFFLCSTIHCLQTPAATALKEPNSVILSETLARKIFDIRDNDFQSTLGKVIAIGSDSLPYKITGIARDVSRKFTPAI
jgi:hypothetical protein